MAGRLFPVYPLYPLGPGPVPVAFAAETFVAADRTGYALSAAPVVAWYPNGSWTVVRHPSTLPTVERGTLVAVRTDPGRMYDDGFLAYWAGDYDRARTALQAVGEGRDARPWYYLALTHWVLGDEKAAERAARYAAALTVTFPEDNSRVLLDLERVQGEPRRRLFAAAAEVGTAEAARTVLQAGPPK
jgi:hypothetical protein